MIRLSDIALRLSDRLPPASRFLAQRQLHHPIFHKFGWGIAASVFAQTVLFAIETVESLQAITHREVRNGIQITVGYFQPLPSPLQLWLHSSAWAILLLCVLLLLAVPLSDLALRRRPGGGLLCMRGWAVPPRQIWAGTWLPFAGAMLLLLAGEGCTAVLCRMIYQLTPEAARLGIG